MPEQDIQNVDLSQLPDSPAAIRQLLSRWVHCPGCGSADIDHSVYLEHRNYPNPDREVHQLRCDECGYGDEAHRPMDEQ